MLKSTGDFINKLHSYKSLSGQKLVSFNIFSFFTNVSLEKTINLIADELFSEKNLNQPLMKKEIFIKLLRFCTRMYYTNKLMVLPWDHHLDLQMQISFLPI